MFKEKILQKMAAHLWAKPYTHIRVDGLWEGCKKGHFLEY